MAAKRGRAPGFEMSGEHRRKIANSNILKCLIDHAQGQREMSQTQVTAAIALLRKVLPDLSASDNRNETTVTYVAELPAVAPSVNEWLKSSGAPSPDRKLN